MNLHNAEFVRSVTSVADCPKDGLPQIAFAGKSNVGKSSVINKLLLRKNFARVGEAPGKTTHINFFRIDEAMYLVDLPGYGYAKVPTERKKRALGQAHGGLFCRAGYAYLRRHARRRTPCADSKRCGHGELLSAVRQALRGRGQQA